MSRRLIRAQRLDSSWRNGSPADKNLPLPARVMANRVWEHLFGRGIVQTVDNFGVSGDVPSHPELLDYLAETFRDDGWSVKKLVRRIVLSRTYRLSSEVVPDECWRRDPSDHLLWRHAPRRPRRQKESARACATLVTSGNARCSWWPQASAAKNLRVDEVPDERTAGAAVRDDRPREHASKRLSPAASWLDADITGGVRFCRAEHGDRQP